ncbi:MAG: ABC transporter ATP-binding protein [Spirochaetales bacterium]|nr:ABC transporter ATP-binding protein [Spirochaetales bacterium]
MKKGTRIHAHNLSFCWPQKQEFLFKGWELEVEPGETLCLLGPNGCGKTTLLEIMLGWRKPSSGCIQIGGMNLSELSSRERGQMMALVPQEERLPFEYCALDYVLLGRAPHLTPLQSPGEKDVILAQEALEEVGIGHLAQRPVPRLSGGERRMVLLARALAQNPSIMLLDEPANHLDPGNQERMLVLLKALQDQGVTLVVSTHDPEFAGRISHKLALLKSSESLIVGSPQTLLTCENLESLYGTPVQIIEAYGRQIMVWGEPTPMG